MKNRVQKFLKNTKKFINTYHIICIIAVFTALAFINIYGKTYEMEARLKESSNDIPRAIQTINNNMDNRNPVQIPIIDTNSKTPISTGTSSNITTKIHPKNSTFNTTTTKNYPETSVFNIITTEKIPEISIPETTTIIPEVNEEPEIIAPKYTTHIIALNDNFYNLSKKYYGDNKYYKALMEYNKYDENDILHIGDKIIIPNIEDEEFIGIYNRIEKTEREEINSFIESTKGQIIQAGDKNTYKYGVRTDPTIDIVVPSGNNMKNYTGKVDISKFKLLGNYSTTGYTPTCIHCCGSDKGIGAAGVPIICGYSVAAPDNIPLGTTLYIEGYGFYVVEDRGNFGYTNIDIACPTHEDCALVTNMAKDVKVYIVPNN